MIKQTTIKLSIMIFILVSIAIPVDVPHVNATGLTIYKNGDKYVKLGGRIQLQYHYKNPDGSDSVDSLFFRRFRPYIEGSIHKDWKGKFQWDMGKAKDANEIAVKDAYLQYKGFNNHKITIGNKKTPFSREFLTSSKKQQLVERTFVGDHNYGSPDRMLGIIIEGHNKTKMITYAFAVGNENLDPDANKLDFGSPANNDNDWNQGWIVAGRVDFHPFGLLKFSQGDFNGDTKATIGVAAFSWSNDNDNNTRTTAGVASDPTNKPDVDSVVGFEVSGAFRTSGFSVDAEYNSFDADTVDSTVTSGIYKNGTTNLINLSIEGGYMIVPSKLELVAGYQTQDADNYAKKWNRTSVGVNYFFAKHDIKTQLTYRMGENLKGQEGNDEDEMFLQMQYVF